MSTPTDAPKEAAFFATIRSWGITRGPNGLIGGVVEGLGARIGLAAVPGRIIVVIAAILLNGLVLVGYAAAWGLLPDRNGAIIIQNFGRGVTNVGALIGIALLTLFGLGGLNDGLIFGGLWNNGWAWTWDDGPNIGGDIPNVVGVIVSIAAIAFGIALVGTIVWLIVWAVRRGSTPSGGAASRPTGGTPPSPAGRPEPGTEQAPPPGTPNTGVWAVPPARRTRPATAPLADASAPTSVAATAATGDSAATPAATPARDHSDTRSSGALVPVASTAVATTAPAGIPQRAPASRTPAPPRPPVPPRPRVPGPGRAAYLTALAWLFLSIAGVLIADRMDALAVHAGIAWFSGFVVGLGVILVGVGLAGRKTGFLGFVGIFLAVILGLIVAASDDMRADFRSDGAIVAIDYGDDSIREIDLFGETIVFDTSAYFPGFGVGHDGICTSYEAGDEDAGAAYTIDASGATGETLFRSSAEVVDLTVKPTSGMAITASGDGDLTVVMPDAGLTCRFIHNFQTVREDGAVTDLVLLNVDTSTGDATVIVREAS